MSSKEEQVAQLLSSYFEFHDALDHAEYVLSITDSDDVREWLLGALGLDETDRVNSKIDDFLTQLFLIREGRAVTKPAPVVVKEPATVSTIKSPKNTLKSASIADESEIPQVVIAPKPVVPKVVPPARTSMRQKCYCLAKTEIGGHPLIGNCLTCGRIICDIEDYGDCLACGAKKESLHWLDVSSIVDSRAATAVEHKDRLVQYDREGTRRTKVYDDSTDWFAESSDVWKGKAEREEALRKARQFEEEKRDARLGMKVEIDFATGQIVVKDKAEEIRNVEAKRDSELAEWVSESDRGTVMQKPKDASGNVLNQDCQDLLELIREKLGKPRKTMLDFNQSSTGFSILDDL